MKIGITTIAYNQPDHLRSLVETASQSSHEVEFHIFTHSKVRKVIQTCFDLMTEYEIHLYDYRINRGVATSWNDGIINMGAGGCDVWVLTNDDVWFSEGDTDKIALAASEHPDAYAIFTSGFHVGYDVPINCHGMSCFVMQPVAIAEVGFYDENFFPAYNEDVDYARRAARAGLKPYIIPDTNIHHIGSAAIATSRNLEQQNLATHGANNEYWKRKWGCPVSEDPTTGFRHPFNNPRFHPHFIGADKRHEPYPPYNRTDRFIVKI